MKPVSFVLVIAVPLFLACNNKKPKETVTYKSEDGKEKVTIDVSQMQDVAEDMEKVKSNLNNLTPMTGEAMNALLPAQLAGAPRTDIDVSSAIGTSVVHGKYKTSDSSSIDVTVIDCAGPAGSGIYAMQYLGMMNIQTDDEDEYTKTIDFNGGKAFENCQKQRPECVLTYFAGGRFLVSLEGDHVGIENLKAAARELKL